MSTVGRRNRSRRFVSGERCECVRDITAGSELCAWRSLGELQMMNGLEGIAERTCEAFVVCAMEDRRKGSIQSDGLWSPKTEGICVGAKVVDVEYVSEPRLGELLSQDGVERLALGYGCGAAVFVCGGVFPAIEFFNVGGSQELVVWVSDVCVYGGRLCELAECVVNGP